MEKETIEFMKMQVEHVNDVLSYVLALTGLAITIMGIAVGYQIFVNERTIKKIKEETEKSILENLKFLIKKEIINQQTMGTSASPVSMIIDTFNHVRSKYPSDNEMIKLLSAYGQSAITQRMRRFNVEFNNHNESTKEAWKETLNKEYSRWVDLYNKDIAKGRDHKNLPDINFIFLKNPDDAETTSNEIKLLIETFYK